MNIYAFKLPSPQRRAGRRAQLSTRQRGEAAGGGTLTERQESSTVTPAQVDVSVPAQWDEKKAGKKKGAYKITDPSGRRPDEQDVEEMRSENSTVLEVK